MKALDLFCCAGGVSVGLARAGFEVTGVDLNPKVEKCWRKGMEPYGGTFVCGNALEFPLEGYDLIWASPPCQAHTILRQLHPEKEYPDLIPATRERLQASGTPWIIENVPGAPLGKDGGNLVTLCGTMFGLQTPDGRADLRRHRLFETSFPIPLRPVCQHGRVGAESLTVTGTGMGPGNRGKDVKRRALSISGHAVEISKGWERSGPRSGTIIIAGKSPELAQFSSAKSRARAVVTVSGDRCNSSNTPRKVLTVTGHTPVDNENRDERHLRQTFSTDDARAAMGIDWMPMAYLSQAIPPAYAEWLGKVFQGWVPPGVQQTLF